MKFLKVFLLIAAVVIGLFSVVIAQNIFGNYSYAETSSNLQPANSTVYIQNGVSGVVTVSDPYLNRKTTIDVIFAPLDSGSGFIVSSNGYIITAFHVVSDPVSLENQQVLRTMNSSDIRNYLEIAAVSGYISKYNPQLGLELLGNSSSGLISIINGQPDLNTTTAMLVKDHLLNVTSQQQVITVTLPGTRSSTSMYAKLVDVGNSSTDDDVALLKIDTLVKLPALPISNITPIAGQSVQIYGFPVLKSGMYSGLNQLIYPSSASGVLTSEIPHNGTPYFEIDAPSEQGYSGGPVVDSHRNVLGIIIYSLESHDQSPLQIEIFGHNLIIPALKIDSSLYLPSQYIIEICQKNHVPIHIN